MLKPVVLMPKNEALARVEANRRLIEERLRGLGAILIRVSIENGSDYYDPDTGYYTIVLIVRIGNKLRSYKPEELGLNILD
jgi:hypothetical protein